MGFFAIIQKIHTVLLSAARAILARLQGIFAPERRPIDNCISDERKQISEKGNVSELSAFPFEEATLPAGTESRLAAVDWDRRDVLVGTLRNAAQLKACLDGRFYYIPTPLLAEAEYPVRYVALFQTPRIFPGNAGIFWYGEVQSAVPVRRGNILEVPQTHGSPDAPYYRYQIRQWLSLSKPIRPHEAGFVRAFTNLFLLENAEFVPELLLDSEEEYRLFMELKRRITTAPPDSTISGFALGDIQVLLAGGSIQMFRSGQLLGTCSIQDFARYPCGSFRRLYSGRDAACPPDLF